MNWRHWIKRLYGVFSTLLEFMRNRGFRFWLPGAVVVSNPERNPKVDFVVSSSGSYSRVRLAHLKEPLTARWIDSMPSSSVLWDIGANIGVFTLQAAQRGIPVVAVEPLLENFLDLQRTLDYNREIASSVLPILGGLASMSGPAELVTQQLRAGYSGSQLGERTDEFGAPLKVQAVRNTLSYTGEQLSLIIGAKKSTFGPPTHIKLDVDGQELNCLAGLKPVWAAGSIRSVLVETGPSIWGNREEIARFMADLDFFPVSSEETVGSGIKLTNVIFERSARV